MSSVTSVPSAVHPLFAQLFAAIVPARTQASYNPIAGVIIRTDGQSRPALVAEVEQTYSQSFLNDMIAGAGPLIQRLSILAFALNPERKARTWIC